MFRRRYLVTVEFLAPLVTRPRPCRRFYTRRAAERYALMFSREAWRLGCLTECSVSNSS